MSQTVVLADVDNTLYDWPAFFAPSFRAMIRVLSRELSVSEDQLYEECKAVFGRHRSLEYAFVIQELDSVKSAGTERMRYLIEQGRGAFRSVQKKRLVPYPGVAETLAWLQDQDVLVVGVTNSSVYRTQQRLYSLGLDSLLAGLVAWEGFEGSVNSVTEGFVEGGRTRKRSRLARVWTVAEADCKPSERHYSLALESLGAKPSDAWAIGDSLAKDLEPAARIGIRTIWARYGSAFDPDDTNMATLLRITHWTSSRIATTYRKDDFVPDAVIDTFSELKGLIPAKYPTLF